MRRAGPGNLNSEHALSITMDVEFCVAAMHDAMARCFASYDSLQNAERVLDRLVEAESPNGVALRIEPTN